ncbi:MAG: hypothetical protein N2746_12190 [Deltaproteobacteria bacterium]|nr:hypothetical protein [Deltaproteobacteria bacterium]
MLVKFDRKLYTENAIKKAYSEFLNKELSTIKKSSKDFVVELPENIEEDDIRYFESMVLLFTIEEIRK